VKTLFLADLLAGPAPAANVLRPPTSDVQVQGVSPWTTVFFPSLLPRLTFVFIHHLPPCPIYLEKITIIESWTPATQT
jgi:hypothetical protein